MAVRVILEVKAKPGTGGEVVAFFRSILPETRAYEGCTRVETLQNSEDADNVLLVEDWDTHEQYEKYLAWQRERGASATGSSSRDWGGGGLPKAAEHPALRRDRRLSRDRARPPRGARPIPVTETCPPIYLSAAVPVA